MKHHRESQILNLKFEIGRSKRKKARRFVAFGLALHYTILPVAIIPANIVLRLLLVRE